MVPRARRLTIRPERPKYPYAISSLMPRPYEPSHRPGMLDRAPDRLPRTRPGRPAPAGAAAPAPAQGLTAGDRQMLHAGRADGSRVVRPAGRGSRIRTGGLPLPKRTRYQAAPSPVHPAAAGPGPGYGPGRRHESPVPAL